MCVCVWDYVLACVIVTTCVCLCVCPVTLHWRCVCFGMFQQIVNKKMFLYFLSFSWIFVHCHWLKPQKKKIIRRVKNCEGKNELLVQLMSQISWCLRAADWRQKTEVIRDLLWGKTLHSVSAVVQQSETSTEDLSGAGLRSRQQLIQQLIQQMN